MASGAEDYLQGMSNFEPYEVSKAKGVVSNILSFETHETLSPEYLERVSSKIIDRLIEGGVTIPEDFRLI